MNKDLTNGDPKIVLWKFSIPLFVSVIFQQLYNIADSVIAGRYAGEDALAAVGASYPITMIFMAVAVGSNIGCSVIISNLFGAKLYKKLKTAISTILITVIVMSAILTIAGIASSDVLMKLIKTPNNIFTDGSLYLKIYVGGFIFLFMYNVVTGVFSALGDSKTPLYFLIGSSLGNVLLDYIFVAKFGWGVAGVAWATFLAQGIAGVLVVITLFYRLKDIKTEGKIVLFSKDMLWDISKIAIPSILQQSFISIGNIFVQSLVNSYGSSVIAGYSAAIKLNTFTITSFTTLGNGISNFTAQNIGAGKKERIPKGFIASVILAIIIAVPFFLLYFFGGEVVVKLFLDKDSQVALNTGMDFLRIVSPFYFVILIKLMADGVLRGAQHMGKFMISTFTDLILRVVLAYVFAVFFESKGIWMSWPVGWSVSAIISLIFYLQYKSSIKRESLINN